MPDYGVIAALWPDEATAKRLALPEREEALPPEELHVTLVFMGEAEDLDRESIEASLTTVAAGWSPVSGIFNGIARFVPDAEGLQPVVTTFDAPGLCAMREAIREALGFLDGEHGFCPHMTLAYLPEDETQNPPIPLEEVTFDRITLAWGDPSDLVHFPLTGEAITVVKPPEPITIGDEEEEMAPKIKQAGILEDLFADEVEPVVIPAEGTPLESPSVNGEARPVAEPVGEGTWESLFHTEGEWTDDGRLSLPGAWSWRDLPWTLMYNRSSEGHTTAVAGGAVTEMFRDGNKIMARGIYSADEEGQELRRLVGEGVLTQVSIDANFPESSVIYEENEDGDFLMTVVSGIIMGCTVLPMGAQGTTWIRNTDGEQEAVAAAGATLLPSEWFENPNLSELTPLTITEDGRVFGHAAGWDTCHIGVPNECLSAPKSKTNYSYFLTGSVETDEGPMPVGQIVMNTNHAALNLKSPKAVDHYAHTGASAADINVGEDEHGIWVAGALRASCRDEDQRVLQASALSGDWRKIRGNLELVALLAVNTPGFPIPRTRALVASGKQQALVGLTASIDRPIPTGEFTDLERIALRDLDDRVLEGLDARVLSG